MRSIRQPRWLRRAAQLWRRSIMVRVVSLSVVLSTLVVSMTTMVVLRNVASGLTEHRQSIVLSEARAGLLRAQGQLDAQVNSDAGQTLSQFVDTLAATRAENRPYELVLIGPITNSGQMPSRESGEVAASDLPDDLVASVLKSDAMYWEYSSAEVGNAEKKEPVIIVGRRMQTSAHSDQYALFYVYCLSVQAQALSLLQRALIFGDVVIVALLALISWSMTRRVVAPVRVARKTAEGFSAGNFDQRMEVRGEDDIARLSMSFNKMAESLQRQIRQLENLSALQQRFVSDVSHELRTPLTTVQMASDVIHEARDTLDPQVARAAELLDRQLQRFAALLADLLDLSRIDAGAAELALEDVDLAEVAIAAAADATIKRSGIRVVPRGVKRRAVVQADPRRVDRIVRNLVNNAVAYSSSAKLEIVVASTPEVASLSVRDFGVGMTSEQTQHVFDRFWRSDPARSQGGTGLGLAIAKEDAELHGGLLQVWSVPGKGTEFILTLPKAGYEAKTPAIASVFA